MITSFRETELTQRLETVEKLDEAPKHSAEEQEQLEQDYENRAIMTQTFDMDLPPSDDDDYEEYDSDDEPELDELPLLHWKSSDDIAPQVQIDAQQAAKDFADQERMRLLYVALTIPPGLQLL